MSLHSWDKEYEDRTSSEPTYSIASVYQFDVDEDLKSSERQEGSEYSEEPSSTFDSDVPHVVPWKLIISLAFPAQLSHKVKYTRLIEKYRKHPRLENPAVKAHRFCHIEYFLLPDDTEPKKVDLVIFPAVAKVFLESGVKIVKLWEEGDRAWVSWTQTFNINVTKELLKKISVHKITLKLWNTKDKISRKVRYGLKTAGSLDDLGSVEEVRRLVVSQRSLSAMGSEKASAIRTSWEQEDPPDKQDRAEKQSRCPRGSRQIEAESSPKSCEEHEKSASRGNNSKAQTMPLPEVTMMEINEIIERSSFSSLDRQRTQARGKDSEGQKKSQKRKPPSGMEEAAGRKLVGHWKQSAFSIQLVVMPLLAGWQTIMSRGSEKSANVLDCLLTLRTEVPIMTEEQKQDLNPLIIKIESASCLPAQPVPIPELEFLKYPHRGVGGHGTCLCGSPNNTNSYQFHNTPIHTTEGEPHATHIHFQDINVVFLGAMHPSDLREYLEGPPMVVEVHDRDRKSEDYSQKPSVFGEDPLDLYLNLPSIISPRETEDNPFESQKKMWDPYGVARVSFADLLLGHKFLDLDVPIHSCEPKLIDPREDSSLRKVEGFRVPKDGLHHGPMPMGNYLDAESQLKLRVDITVPLKAGAKASDLDLLGSPFGRIVILLDHKKLFDLHSLLEDITMVNAKALDLGSYPIKNIQQILLAFKMRVKIQEQQHLDVLTGFHLLDGEIHLFVLEGLADQGLRQIWEGLQQRIHDICYSSTRLREVIVGDLLPSSAMIKDLSQEFGIPISREELSEETLSAVPLEPSPNLEDFRSRTSTLPEEIHAHQEKYLRWRNTVLKNRGQHSLIQKNILGAHQASKRPPKPVVRVIRISTPAHQAVHNYSIQTLNSTELAKKELYQEMAKEPRRRFTYSQNYLSATVEPQDSEEEERRARRRSRQAWLTASGFQVTGLQSSTAGPAGTLRLPPIRELDEEWKENALFANVLKPVLDRERWSWDRRHLDFELYKKPPPFFKLPPAMALEPVTGRR